MKRRVRARLSCDKRIGADVRIADRIRLARAVFSEAEGLTFVKRLDIAAHAPKKVSGWGSMFSMAYLACELVKARSAGSLPVAVYRHGDKGRSKLREHPLTKLLSGMANEFSTGRDLIHWAWIYRDTFGTAYIYVEYRRGLPCALYPVLSTVRPDYDRSRPEGERMRYVVYEGDDYVPAGTYRPHQIIAFKTPISKDGGMTGESLANYAASEIGLSIDLEEYYSKMLHNGQHAPGHIELPENVKPGDEKLQESLRSAIESKQGIANAGKTPIFWRGAKYVQHAMTMKDASLVEQQLWVLQQVCRATSVPPQKVGDNSRSTYTNTEQSRIEFATDTMAPELAAFESAFQPVLDSIKEEGAYLHFEIDGMMRGDKASQGQYYQLMRYSGIMNGNEIRALEEMNSVPGLDSFLVPANYALMDPDGSIRAVTQGAEPAIGAMSLAPFVADAEERVRAFAEGNDDPEAVRRFAVSVLLPIAKAHAELRSPYNLESETERIINAANSQ